MSNKVKRIIIILLVLILILSMGIAGIFLGYNYVISQNNRFSVLAAKEKEEKYVITASTPGAIMLIINSGDDTGTIAKNLEHKGLIDNASLFTLMSKFNGFDGGYLAGTHYLTKGLSYDEMMYLLCQDPAVVTITFPEGMTYQQIKAKLISSGLQFDPDKLDACMNDPNLFIDYPFVAQINGGPDRDMLLSGYLFPDTYRFDVNASEKEIINTFLQRMNVMLNKEFYDRAASSEINMTMDQIITLASVIQTETTHVQDMFDISIVFHHRLWSDDPSLQLLQSCASINYLRQKDGLPVVWYATDEDISRYADNKYNTYKFPGLPPGPICMPGLSAIQAALYPEKDHNYWYFCATGKDGRTAFAATLEDQEKNIETYKSNWVTPTPSPTPTPTPTSTVTPTVTPAN